ncbi:hypothetical protein [Nocardioides lijunqiniae]|uniref:hypothetical protein n=1 Tax=Nocardioides lijunqiniae TaxID=2760832 RepID=UPI001878F63A|nr:hypothetical protein [Nocardioides lijunqiniae]
MQQREFEKLDETVEGAARHACRALVALDDLRTSPDPVLRAAYRDLHDLLGDLGGLRAQLGVMHLVESLHLSA